MTLEIGALGEVSLANMTSITTMRRHCMILQAMQRCKLIVTLVAGELAGGIRPSDQRRNAALTRYTRTLPDSLHWALQMKLLVLIRLLKVLKQEKGILTEVKKIALGKNRQGM